MASEKFGSIRYTVTNDYIGFRNPPQYVMLYHMVSDIFNDISGMKLDQLDVTFAPFSGEDAETAGRGWRYLGMWIGSGSGRSLKYIFGGWLGGDLYLRSVIEIGIFIHRMLLGNAYEYVYYGWTIEIH